MPKAFYRFAGSITGADGDSASATSPRHRDERLLDARPRTKRRTMTRQAAGRELLARVHALVGEHLAAAEVVFERELTPRHGYVADVLDHVTQFRGKRLRPMLVFLSASASGTIDDDAHPVLAAVVEMIHTATLVHDDVLDEADVRRHVATVNGRWNNETSVLFGDFLFTHAFHLAASLESTLGCRVIGRATNVVCEGEMAQVHERGNLDLDEAAYLAIIEAKTAELCAVSCWLGAHYAGADEAAAAALERYGRALGIAFQIADDLLEVTGDEAEAGKTLGRDFLEQKLTLPAIRLLQTADDRTRTQARLLLAEPTPERWERFAELLERSDAVEYATERAREYAAAARASLVDLPDSPARRLLDDVVDFAAVRSY
jgi:octaprenyl-diphosphate synthase